MINVNLDNGYRQITLTTCPACGMEFHKDAPRYAHIQKHSPEDFGL